MKSFLMLVHNCWLLVRFGSGPLNTVLLITDQPIDCKNVLLRLINALEIFNWCLLILTNGSLNIYTFLYFTVIFI